VAIQYEALIADLFGIVPAYGYHTGRLRCIALVFALALPPVLAWLRRHQWQFTIRSMLIGAAVVAALLSWLQKDIANYLASRPISKESFGPTWELVFFGFVLSAIFTFVVAGNKTYDANNSRQGRPIPGESDKPANTPQPQGGSPPGGSNRGRMVD